MALRNFQCEKCEHEVETLKAAPEHCGQPMKVLLSAPGLKFMEPKLKEKGMSQMKDQSKILKERAKEHARANDWHDLTQTNNVDMAKRQGWIKEDGTIKKRIDDI